MRLILFLLCRANLNWGEACIERSKRLDAESHAAMDRAEAYFANASSLADRLGLRAR